MDLLAGLLGDQAACREAGRAMGGLGEPAVAPILQAMRNDPDVAKRSACYQALRKIGKPMEAPVRGLLSDGQATIDARTAAARALTGLEKPETETVAAVAALIDHEDLGLARACLETLASFGPGCEPATDRLVSAMRRLSAKARAGGMISNRGELCAIALGSIGKSARRQVLAMIASEDARLAEYGGIAASQWQELDEEMVDSLVAAVRRFRNPRRQLVTALGKAGEHGGKAVGVLLEKMDAIGLKQAVIVTLGEIGPAAADAAPTLVDELTSEAVHASYAAAALGGIGAVNDDVVPALAEALHSDSVFVRTQAAGALRGIGKDARPAVPDLVSVLDDRNHSVVDAALGALAKAVQPEDAETVAPALLKLVRSGKRATRVRKAAEILPLFGKANRPYADDLIAIAEDSKQNLNIRHQAMKALAGLEADHAKAIACLKRIAESDAPTANRMAADALKDLTTSE
jgi:HEAT repeat protein